GAGGPRPARDSGPVVTRPRSTGDDQERDVATPAVPVVRADPGPDTGARGGPSPGSGDPVVTDGRPSPVVARPLRAETPSTGVDVGSEGPTIRVHIGRLEVRAAPAPSSSRPRSDPPGPDTSLAEYLRGHRGGR
ncbi:hypothetical protein KR546_17560, partial [Nitriliruptoria bacterium AS10]